MKPFEMINEIEILRQMMDNTYYSNMATHIFYTGNVIKESESGSSRIRSSDLYPGLVLETFITEDSGGEDVFVSSIKMLSLTSSSLQFDTVYEAFQIGDRDPVIVVHSPSSYVRSYLDLRGINTDFLCEEGLFDEIDEAVQEEEDCQSEIASLEAEAEYLIGELDSVLKKIVQKVKS